MCANMTFEITMSDAPQSYLMLPYVDSARSTSRSSIGSSSSWNNPSRVCFQRMVCSPLHSHTSKDVFTNIYQVYYQICLLTWILPHIQLNVPDVCYSLGEAIFPYILFTSKFAQFHFIASSYMGFIKFVYAICDSFVIDSSENFEGLNHISPHSTIF